MRVCAGENLITPPRSCPSGNSNNMLANVIGTSMPLVIQYSVTSKSIAISLQWLCKPSLLFAKRPLKMIILTEPHFVCDAAVVGTTREGIDGATHVLHDVTSKWGCASPRPRCL